MAVSPYYDLAIAFACRVLTIALLPSPSGGKSVILTGITFAFGAKASVTARGPNTKGFVREGASSAEVTITLRNKGPDAYKPDVYGKAIYVTRRINAEGGGGYKLADWNKKTVSTQRAELASLCDHFQIQVDNPVNVRILRLC
jgi:chromosome segregation ATPase